MTRFHDPEGCKVISARDAIEEIGQQADIETAPVLLQRLYAVALTLDSDVIDGVSVGWKTATRTVGVYAFWYGNADIDDGRHIAQMARCDIEELIEYTSELARILRETINDPRTW